MASLQLRHLDLCLNSLQAAGCAALSQAMRPFSLESILLDANNVGVQGAEAWSNAFLPPPPPVEDGGGGAPQVLRILSLRDNKIGAEGAVHIAKGASS
jgi:hypothetical protein